MDFLIMLVNVVLSMLILLYFSVVVLLKNSFFAFSTDANVRESLEMKVFDPDFQMSDQQMLDLLKKVDLESHGYKREVTTKLVSDPDSDKTNYEKSYLYYKDVDCSKLREIDQELQTLLPGKFKYLSLPSRKRKTFPFS